MYWRTVLLAVCSIIIIIIIFTNVNSCEWWQISEFTREQKNIRVSPKNVYYRKSVFNKSNEQHSNVISFGAFFFSAKRSLLLLIFRTRNNLKWQSQKDNTNTQIRIHVFILLHLLAFIVDDIVWRQTFIYFFCTSTLSVVLIGFPNRKIENCNRN